jgi:hypothetical protein
VINGSKAQSARHEGFLLKPSVSGGAQRTVIKKAVRGLNLLAKNKGA